MCSLSSANAPHAAVIMESSYSFRKFLTRHAQVRLYRGSSLCSAICPSLLFPSSLCRFFFASYHICVTGLMYSSAEITRSCFQSHVFKLRGTSMEHLRFLITDGDVALVSVSLEWWEFFLLSSVSVAVASSFRLERLTFTQP